MTTGHVSTKDNNEIFFKDWGRGPPVVFSHGWPLSMTSTMKDAFHNDLLAFLRS